MAYWQSPFRTKCIVSADYAGRRMPTKGRTPVVIGYERPPNWHHRPSMACKIKDFWVIPAGDVNPLQADFGFRGSYVHLGSPVFDLFQTKKRSLASSGAFFADIAPFFL